MKSGRCFVGDDNDRHYADDIGKSDNDFPKCALTTRPFGQDDLDPMIKGLGLFRIVQLAVLAAMWIYLYVIKWRQDGNNETPAWCSPSDVVPAVDATLQPVRGGLFDNNFANRDSGGNDTARQLLLRFLAENSDYHNITNVTNSTTRPSGPVNLDLIDDYDILGQQQLSRTAENWLVAYIFLSLAYTLVDLGLLGAIWSASGIGTPTEPLGRILFLRPLLRFKVVAMNVVLLAVVLAGVLMVHYNRLDDWGCRPPGDVFGNITTNVTAGDGNGGRFVANASSNSSSSNATDDALSTPFEYQTTLEDTIWYVWFCIVLVLQALELLIWPCIVTNNVMHQVRLGIFTEQRMASIRDRCCGTCCFAFGAATCFRTGGTGFTGGGAVTRGGSFIDVTNSMMDFLYNPDGVLDVVFSDWYLAFKMLVRVQRERLYEKQQQLQLDHDGESGRRCDGAIDNDSVVTASMGQDELLEAGGASSSMRHSPPYIRSIGVGRWSEGGENESGFEIVSSHHLQLLSPDIEGDLALLKQAQHYIRHADAIYDKFPKFLRREASRKKRLVARIFGGLKALDDIVLTNDSIIMLDEIGFQDTGLKYAKFDQLGMDETPYAILVDMKLEDVIIAIRGTATLEDAAVRTIVLLLSFSIRLCALLTS